VGDLLYIELAQKISLTKAAIHSEVEEHHHQKLRFRSCKKR
jgi:hypothetical protein